MAKFSSPSLAILDKNCSRIGFRRPEIQNFLGGIPQTPPPVGVNSALFYTLLRATAAVLPAPLSQNIFLRRCIYAYFWLTPNKENRVHTGFKTSITCISNST